jgi:hypothetical protein
MHRQIWSQWRWQWQQQWGWEGEIVPTFLGAVWCVEAFNGVGVQDVESLILVGALFLLDGGMRKEEKERKQKRNCHGGGGFPWGWTCLVGNHQLLCSCFVFEFVFVIYLNFFI